MPDTVAIPEHADLRQETRPLSDAARRARAEAEARRASASVEVVPPEAGGRKGPEPVRYGDWEKNGIISDF